MFEVLCFYKFTVFKILIAVLLQVCFELVVLFSSVLLVIDALPTFAIDSLPSHSSKFVETGKETELFLKTDNILQHNGTEETVAEQDDYKTETPLSVFTDFTAKNTPDHISTSDQSRRIFSYRIFLETTTAVSTTTPANLLFQPKAEIWKSQETEPIVDESRKFPTRELDLNSNTLKQSYDISNEPSNLSKRWNQYLKTINETRRILNSEHIDLKSPSTEDKPVSTTNEATIANSSVEEAGLDIHGIDNSSLAGNLPGNLGNSSNSTVEFVSFQKIYSYFFKNPHQPFALDALAVPSLESSAEGDKNHIEIQLPTNEVKSTHSENSDWILQSKALELNEINEVETSPLSSVEVSKQLAPIDYSNSDTTRISRKLENRIPLHTISQQNEISTISELNSKSNGNFYRNQSRIDKPMKENDPVNPCLIPEGLIAKPDCPFIIDSVVTEETVYNTVTDSVSSDTDTETTDNNPRANVEFSMNDSSSVLNHFNENSDESIVSGDTLEQTTEQVSNLTRIRDGVDDKYIIYLGRNFAPPISNENINVQSIAEGNTQVIHTIRVIGNGKFNNIPKQSNSDEVPSQSSKNYSENEQSPDTIEIDKRGNYSLDSNTYIDNDVRFQSETIKSPNISITPRAIATDQVENNNRNFYKSEINSKPVTPFAEPNKIDIQFTANIGSSGKESINPKRDQLLPVNEDKNELKQFSIIENFDESSQTSEQTGDNSDVPNVETMDIQGSAEESTFSTVSDLVMETPEEELFVISKLQSHQDRPDNPTIVYANDGNETNVPIVLLAEDRYADGSYKFEYETADGTLRKEVGSVLESGGVGKYGRYA